MDYTSAERKADRLYHYAVFLFEQETQMELLDGIQRLPHVWMRSKVQAELGIREQDKVYFYMHGFDEGGFKRDVQIRMVVREQGPDG